MPFSVKNLSIKWINFTAQQLDEVSDDRHFLKKVNASLNGVRIRAAKVSLP